MRKLFQALFPGALVFAAAIALAVSVPEASLAGYTEAYGRVVYGAGLALGWVFHRSRVFIVLLCIGIIDIGFADELDRYELVLTFGTVLLALIGALSPTRDRGLLSRGGVAQLAVAAAFAGGAAALFAEPAAVKSFAGTERTFVDTIAWPQIPAPTLAVAILSIALVGYGFYRWRGPVDRAFIWVVLMILLAMHPAMGAARSALMLAAAGLTLTLSVVETSYMLAYRDDLTGLPGRRALMQALDGVSGLYTIAMVDVDHFKKFNDRHGHDVGDQVLQMVASRLARAPGGGKAFRYGGEEFTLLYPGRTREDALPHLEAVRETIEESKFSLRSWRRPRKKPKEADKAKTKAKRPKKLSVTVSIGMADTAGDDDTPQVVLKRSDQALYRAKKKGRNQVSK